MRTPTKYLFCMLVLAVVIGLGVAPAQAQEPRISVYFDNCTTRETECPAPGLGEICFVVEDVNTLFSTVEFKIDYPPCMFYAGDIHLPGALYLGATPTGITITFPIPLNGWGPVVVARAQVFWNCASCDHFGVVSTAPHPSTGDLIAIEFMTYRVIPLAAQNSYVGHITAKMDIKPGSCPNPFNLKLFEAAEGENPRKGGVLPVAIVGTPDFDVSQIDVSTILLEGVAPLMQGGGPKVDDVTTPDADLTECDCNTAHADGIDDLVMKFRSQDIAAAISPGAAGDFRTMTLTGYLLDGSPFEAQDCIVFVGKEPGIAVQGPPGTALYGAYPNPFNPSTTIKYAVGEEGMVRLAVYDVRGGLVAELVHGNKAAGEYAVEWNAGNLPSGIYFFHLTAGDYSETKKTVLLK